MMAKGTRPVGDSSGGESKGEAGSVTIVGNREARRRAIKRETRKIFRRAENQLAGTEVIGGVRVRQGIRGRAIEEIVRSRTLQDRQGGDRSGVMSRVGQLEAESDQPTSGAGNAYVRHAGARLGAQLTGHRLGF